jgi:aspartyl-tRNA(Asn)/glutamyl-tRNA(Gln) amidotransferase subunit B
MSARDERFELVVGLEVHVQLATATKIFCGCSTNFGAPPNTNVCPVCLGLPGALPVLNGNAVTLAMRTALALGCRVHTTSIFERKNYFYPDLPKGYQISQYEWPIATGGGVSIAGGRRIGVTRAHMEEDAGKSVHDRYQGATAIDLNRAGVPLVEIVSEPDIRSAAEAGVYLRTLKQILEYARVSDVSMEKGSLRVDANVSVRPQGETELGTKTEIKNLNSFSAVERAIEVERVRQIALIERGERVKQQTLLWDERAEQVRPARSKEESHDYRYFPDPDLPQLWLELETIERVRQEMPELPTARRERFEAAYGLGAYDIDVLTASPEVADYFEEVARAHGDAKSAANWVMGEVLAAIKSDGGEIADFRVRPSDLSALLGFVRAGTISNSAAKQVFATMRQTGDQAATIIERKGLAQVSDDASLDAWIDEALAERGDEAQRLAAGERRLLGVIVGVVMKKSGGRADPRRVNQLLAARFGS